MIYDPYPFKRCTNCGREYPKTKTYFFARKLSNDGLKPTCKICASAYCKQWQQQHPKYSTERNRKHREQGKVQSAKYYRNHAESVKAKSAKYAREHPEQVRRNAAKWRRTHPEEIRVRSHIRRAQARDSGGSHTVADIQAQLKRQKKRCYYCGQKLNGKYHVDHVIPLSRGGGNGPDNLVVTCPTCNLRKKARMPHEWPEGGRLL